MKKTVTVFITLAIISIAVMLCGTQVYASYDDHGYWAEENATYPTLELGKETKVELNKTDYHKDYKFKTKFFTGYRISIKYVSGEGACRTHVFDADHSSYLDQFKSINASNRVQTISYEYMNVMDSGYDIICFDSYDVENEYGTDVTISVKIDELKTYTIKYNLNGGTCIYFLDDQLKTTEKPITLRSEKPTKSGYTFQGWSTTKNGSVAYKAGAQYNKSANVTLYAVWKKNVAKTKTYTVKYNLNGGKGNFKNQTKTKDKALTLRSGKPTKTGYTFQGWSTKKNGNVAYNAGAKYKKNANVTLYAKWAAKKYTVKYNLNGGKGTFKNQTKTYGKALTLRSGKPTKKGYTFQGWSTKKNGNVSYKAGAKYKANKAATLYAVWKKTPFNATYTIKYDLKGGKGTLKEHTYKKHVKSKDKAIKLHSYEPRKNGYLFQGWATSKDGKIAYNPGAQYKKNKSITLYAVWKKVSSGQITTTFEDGDSHEIVTLAVPYSDNYFSGNPKNINKGLAKLSAVAASTAYEKKYAEELLKNCKFKSIERSKNGITRANNNHANYTIGYKKTGGKYVVAILVKGTSANYEWVSNFNLGTGGDHAGFSIAEQEILKQVKQYLNSNNVSTKDVVFWVTGHSRGAAIANLLSRDLMGEYKSSKVFAYTFATPRVSTNATEAGYENIKNYINPGDWVTDVAPEKWGYKRYGTDIVMYSFKNKMKKNFKAYTGKEYGGFGEDGKKSLTTAFLNYVPTLEMYNNGYARTDSEGKVISNVYPKDYCQYGLGYLLAGEARSSYWITKSTKDSPQCSVVTAKLVIDGKINKKFAHAHTTATYVAWLNAMYN